MKKIVFMGYPDFSDNSFAVFHQMIKQGVQRKYVWFYYKKNKDYIAKKCQNYFEEHELKNVVFIEAENILKVLWHYLTATAIISTHGCVEMLPLLKWQQKINLWHGMPLKNIAALDGGKSPQKMNSTIATSPVFREVIAKCFELDINQVQKIGSPRMDFLFYDTKKLKSIFGVENHQHIYMWMPTYRKSSEGKEHSDGNVKKTIGGLSAEDLKKLDETLGKKQEFLFVKLHPMDFLNQEMEAFEFKNIKIFTSQAFLEYGYEVNHFLAMADVLITDYSSVYFDYAILNRPIIVYTDDAEAYRNNRGFTNDKIFEVMNTSQVISDKEDLLRVIELPIADLKILDEESNEFINQYAIEQKKSGQSYSEIFLQNNNL